MEIVNLSTINHFSGGRSFDVPNTVTLTQFDRVLFFCVDFQLLWASGTLDPPVDVGGGGPDYTCMASTTSALDGGAAIDVCPTDDQADIVDFANSLNEAPGENYAYLITDTNEVLQQIVLAGNYDFEGSGPEPQRVYGLNYDGDLDVNIGANRLQTTASECFEHSATGTFLTITKDACPPVYTCADNATATTDWVAIVDVCPTDGVDDLVELRNNLFISPGEHYAYLITDTDENVLASTTDTIYNFEGSGLEERRVYGVNYDGELNVVIGANRQQTTATGCIAHSSATLYLTVTKNACAVAYECQESLVATYNWVTQIDLCTTDDAIDTVFLQNNIGVDAGEHYAFLLTDTLEIVREVITGDRYDFDGSGTEEQRVYGINFDGDLMPVIGQHRDNTMATGCYVHSGDDTFITIDKTATCATSIVDRALAEEVSVYPNPAVGVLTVKLPVRFAPTEVSLLSMLGQTVKSVQASGTSGILQFDVAELPAGRYLLRLVDGERLVVKIVTIR